ncbi:MAG: DMT family transporter [Anaerolineaceae bacterium]|nr:DMT family transporter [Anaerolineaceae bacterium]
MTSTSTPDRKSFPILATFAGILFVSTASILIRFAQAEASSLVIAAGRLLVASLILVPWAVIKYRQDYQSLSRSEIFKGLLSGVFLALHFLSWIKSLELTSVASSVVLVTTTPLWVALLSPAVLHERLRKGLVIGLLVAIIGSGVVGIGQTCRLSVDGFVCQPLTWSSQSLLGNFLALVGAWMAAGYILIGRQLRKKLNTISYTAFVYGIAALILLALVGLRQEPVFSYSGTTYLWLLALGLIPQLLGHSLFNWALKYLSAAFVSLTLLGEPIGTIILALILLKESPTLLEGVGAGLILIGIVAATLGRNKPSNAA